LGFVADSDVPLVFGETTCAILGRRETGWDNVQRNRDQKVGSSNPSERVD